MSNTVASSVASERWVETTVGELAEYITSGSRDWSKYYADSGAIFIRTQDINRNRLSLNEVAFVKLPEKVEGKRSLVRKGDLLVTITGANVGKVAVVEGEIPEAYVSQSVCLVRLRDPSLAKFVHLQLTAKRGDKTTVEAMAYGLGRPVLNLENIRSAPIRLAPHKAQVLIVAEIEKQFSRLDEAVVNLNRVKANLKRYKAAVLKAAVEGALVPIKNRQTTKICEVADLVTKGSSPNWQGFTYADSGVVFVRSQNVGWGNLDLSDVAHLPSAFNEKERKSVLRIGDVLLNIVGASIGRTAVVTPEIEGGNVNQAVAVIRLNKERMLPKYLMLNLLSPGTQTAIHTEKVDVARANVSLSDIKDFSVLFPSLAEQGTMVAEVERRMSVIEELEATVEANLTRADRLRQSILQRAFRGELHIENKSHV